MKGLKIKKARDIRALNSSVIQLEGLEPVRDTGSNNPGV